MAKHLTIFALLTLPLFRTSVLAAPLPGGSDGDSHVTLPHPTTTSPGLEIRAADPQGDEPTLPMDPYWLATNPDTQTGTRTEPDMILKLHGVEVETSMTTADSLKPREAAKPASETQPQPQIAARANPLKIYDDTPPKGIEPAMKAVDTLEGRDAAEDEIADISPPPPPPPPPSSHSMKRDITGDTRIQLDENYVYYGLDLEMEHADALERRAADYETSKDLPPVPAPLPPQTTYSEVVVGEEEGPTPVQHVQTGYPPVPSAVLAMDPADTLDRRQVDYVNPQAQPTRSVSSFYRNSENYNTGGSLESFMTQVETLEGDERK